MADLQIIVALAKNNMIGVNGDMPWYLPDDLKHFKQVTATYPIVMGRRTFESIGRVLPNRRNIMVSKTFDKKIEGLEVVGSLKDAMDLVGDSVLMVIGGARMYEEALPYASTLHLTRIHKSFDGDTKFPDFNESDFVLTDTQLKHSDECDFDYEYQTWHRK